jgi:glycosyltransferase involved in cell wall biosynthesis
MPDTVPPATHLDRHNVAVVIPALNEALRIRGVVEGALAQCDCVIVVDDGSDDDTAAQLADLPLTLLRHARRMGKGASLRDGFREALRQDARAVLTMDGDGQHAADDIPRLLGTRCVSVPIESRYKCVHSDEQFRASHFRPLRDLWRITSHIVLQVLRHGGLPAVYRSVRANPPLVHDPGGEFAAPCAGARMQRAG